MPGDKPANGNSAAQPLRAAAGSTRVRAVAASALLHGLFAAALWQIEWRPPAPELRSAAALPVELRMLAELPPRPTPEAPEPESTLPPQGDPPSTDPADADPDVEAVSETATDVRRPAEASGDPPPDSPPLAQDTSPPPAELAPLVPEDYDFDVARNEAVARVIESLRDQSEYRRFSLEGQPGGEEHGGEEYGAGTEEPPDIFEAAAKLRSAGVMTRGRARSKIARTIVDLCNELTGGFSILGFVNVCADPPPRADLFGHLRPTYMESVPLCTADEELQIEIEETGSGAVGTFTCVLVSPEARRTFYGRYDPALAGWLPSEAAAGSADVP